jgi:hypothetical protein
MALNYEEPPELHPGDEAFLAPPRLTWLGKATNVLLKPADVLRLGWGFQRPLTLAAIKAQACAHANLPPNFSVHDRDPAASDDDSTWHAAKFEAAVNLLFNGSVKLTSLGRHVASTGIRNRCAESERLVGLAWSWRARGGGAHPRIEQREVRVRVPPRLDKGPTAARLASRPRFVARLRVRHALARAGPACAARPVRAPVFVLGLPRTGTTFLHRLLSLDPASRCPQTYELFDPGAHGLQVGAEQGVQTRAPGGCRAGSRGCRAGVG